MFKLKLLPARNRLCVLQNSSLYQGIIEGSCEQNLYFNNILVHIKRDITSLWLFNVWLRIETVSFLELFLEKQDFSHVSRINVLVITKNIFFLLNSLFAKLSNWLLGLVNRVWAKFRFPELIYSELNYDITLRIFVIKKEIWTKVLILLFCSPFKKLKESLSLWQNWGNHKCFFQTS